MTYVWIGNNHGHPRATARGYVREHVLIAERALGGYLPLGAVVHHVDGKTTNNAKTNLVICQDQTYHMLLHARQRILELGGDPRTSKICSDCGALKGKTEFHNDKSCRDGLNWRCKDCARSRSDQYRIEHLDAVKARKREWGKQRYTKRKALLVCARVSDDPTLKIETVEPVEVEEPEFALNQGA